MQIVSVKCQSLFSGKNKKSIINLSAGEYAQRVPINIYLKELDTLSREGGNSELVFVTY